MAINSKYKLLRATTIELSNLVNEYLDKGWFLSGSPFRTGNRIFIAGDRAYPGSCKYTNEIAQAVIKI